MGLDPSPDVYQEKMSLLFLEMENVNVYFDDFFILEFESFESHSLTIQEVFIRVRKANLQINMAKSKFAAIESEYLGSKISHQGFKPQQKLKQS